MRAGRTLRHLLTSRHAVRRAFPEATLARIEQAVHAGEQSHDGELRFAVEAGLELPALLADETPRERALEVFSMLRVWDTARNNGVLVYVLYADRDVEIVADRGYNGRAAEEEWRAVCGHMRSHFAAGRFEQGALEGIAAASAVMARHFPLTGGRSVDELPDRPAVL